MSVTPLYKKLGIKSDCSILVLNLPRSYLTFFLEFPPNVIININYENKKEGFIHIFVRTNLELETLFKQAKKHLQKDGILWISWPKKTSKIESELDKNIIREYGLKNGLVDTKIASIDQDWSGHKFVFRLIDR